MATPEEGRATSSSYGGGGAGGKFRKKPPRRQTTPYDRPLTALRVNTTNTTSNSSWLTKLVVEPASKLISYGADRFFATVFRRRLPPPPPPQPPEANAAASDEDQVVGPDDVQDGAQEPRGDDCREPINSSSSSVVHELEQLLKQKTFSRSEIVQLTELLQSRAVGVSHENTSQKNEEPASDFGRHQGFASAHLEGNMNDEGIRSSAVVSTPVRSSKVLDNIASPAEVAKAYMGSRPSKVSPSELGIRSQLSREDAGLLTTMPFASKSPITLMTKKTSVSMGAPENGFLTPSSRSRSAIYNMARTPYSRVHPTSILKGSGINNNKGFAGPSTSSPLSLVENNEKFEHQPVTLKRRSSVLDDEGGSVGPIRRIRQRSNLLGSRFNQNAHGMGIGSHSKHKPELSGGQSNKALKNVVENNNESVPSTSYSRAPPSRSSEVASRILSKLEEMTPKEKSPESKLVAARERSPLKSPPSVLPGQSRRSTEDVGSSKLLLDVDGDHKFGDRANAILPDAQDSSPQKQEKGKAKDSEPKISVVPSVMWNSVSNNNSTVSLKASTPGIGTSGSVLNNGASKPLQKKRAFRMSAEEDSVEQDDVQCNGLASRSLYELKAPTGSPLTDSSLAPAGGYKPVNRTVESTDKSPSGNTSSRTDEVSPGATINVGEGTSGNAVPVSEETRSTSQPEAFTSSFVASDKAKLANNPPSNSFSSKVADKFPSAESFRRAEPEVRRSSSSDNTSVSIGSEVKAPESHEMFPKPGDVNGNCKDVSSPASNGPLFSSSSALSFAAVPSRDANQISTGSDNFFTSSTSITNFAPTGASTSSSFSSNIFGLTTKPSGPAEHVPKFGSSVDPSTGASPASTTKVELNTIFGSSSSSASSGSSSIFGLSSFANSTGSNLQGSLFANSSNTPVSDAGTVSQGTSTQLFSSTPAAPFSVNTGTLFGTSPSTTFSFTSSASSSGPTSLAPLGGPTSSPFSLGGSSTTASTSTISSPGIYSFGLSSSSSTPTVGLSSGTSPVFGLGGTSTPNISFTSGSSGTLNSVGSSSSSFSSSSAPSTGFGSTWASQKSPVFSSTFTPPSPSTGFVFGGASTSSSGPGFPFTSSSVSSLSSPSLLNTQPIFGDPPMGGGFAASPGNNDQMNAEDSMAEDPAPSSAPSPIFGQPSVAPSPPAFGFGLTAPSQVNPFMFGGQQNQVAPQNPSPFQASGSLEFNAGGSFSLGSSGAGDKSGRKIVKISRNKNRKK